MESQVRARVPNSGTGLFFGGDGLFIEKTVLGYNTGRIRQVCVAPVFGEIGAEYGEIARFYENLAISGINVAGRTGTQNRAVMPVEYGLRASSGQ